MEFFKKIKKRFSDGMQNDMKLAMISLLLAIIVWFAISMTQYPSVPKTIEDIKLSVDTIGTLAAENELSVISCDVEKVRVKIKGSRTQIRNIRQDNLEAYIDFDNVSSAGQKNLPIKLRSTSGINYELEAIYPSSANVVLDVSGTKEVQVGAKLPNVTFAEGKAPDEFKCEPGFITISGPSSQLDAIAECYAFSDKVIEDKDSSFTVNTDQIKLYTADGIEIDQSQLTLSSTIFSVTVPVLTQKTVVPKVEVIKSPMSFDKDYVKKRLQLSSDSLTIASNNINGEIPDTLEIGQIALSDIDLGYSMEFDIGTVLENAGMINKSGVDSIAVTFDDTGLARKSITLDSDSIHLSNDGNNYEVLTQKLTISVVAPQEIIDEVTSKDFIAEASLLNVDVSQQKLDIPVTISCLTHDNVWSVTKAKVAVQKNIKQETTESSEE